MSRIYIASSVGLDYFYFLGKIIEKSGYDVSYLYVIDESEYRKYSKNNDFKKVWLRFKMYLVYPLYLLYQGIRSDRRSIFVVTSNTFFAPYFFKFFLKYKSLKVVHVLYDLFPDALEVAGKIKENSMISGAIGKIMKGTQRNCESTIYLGNFLRDHAENRWNKARNSKVIDISTDLTLYDYKHKRLFSEDKVVVHYGGQLGHLHDVDSIIDCVKFICGSDISEKVEFNFYVSGAQALFLTESLKGYPVKIKSAVTSNEWRNDIRKYHIGLVSLSPGGASVCLPSKTYGMMAGGLAILAICPQWSDLSNLVTSLEAGWVVNNSAHIDLNDVCACDYLKEIKAYKSKDEIISNFYLSLKSIIEDRELLEIKRGNAFYGVRSNYNIEILSEKWNEVILSI
jgi:hypothetical protein